MKVVFSIFLFLSTFYSFSFDITVRELHSLITKRLNSEKSVPLALIKGQWLSTNHQPQIFPGSCNPDKVENISLDLYDAWKNINFTPAKGRKLEPVILFNSVDFTYPSEGEAEIKGEVVYVYAGSWSILLPPTELYCTLLDQEARGQNSLVCFQPAHDLNDPCGWYSFFIRE